MATDKLFTRKIPELYDSLLVPLFFEPYARDLACRATEADPIDILETAAGTGALTRVLASRLPASARIVATDLNLPILDQAAANQPRDDRILWQQADALALPFEDQIFDIVVCQFGVMFFPDKLRGYREAHRVVKPGGNFLFNIWDRISESAFAAVVAETHVALFPQDPPDFLIRIPYGYFDVESIHDELLRAGITSIEATSLASISRASSPHDAAIAYCQGTPLRNEIEARDPSRVAEATQAVAEALASRFGSGPIEGHMKSQVFTSIRT